MSKLVRAWGPTANWDTDSQQPPQLRSTTDQTIEWNDSSKSMVRDCDIVHVILLWWSPCVWCSDESEFCLVSDSYRQMLNQTSYLPVCCWVTVDTIPIWQYQNRLRSRLSIQPWSYSVFTQWENYFIQHFKLLTKGDFAVLLWVKNHLSRALILFGTGVKMNSPERLNRVWTELAMCARGGLWSQPLQTGLFSGPASPHNQICTN